MAKKEPKKTENRNEEGLKKSARALDLGNGIEVTMGLLREDGTVEVSYYFSNKVGGLKKTTKAELGDLEVEYSSSQVQDQDLLHFLAQKTR